MSPTKPQQKFLHAMRLLLDFLRGETNPVPAFFKTGKISPKKRKYKYK
jgi:hypothetical protein